MRARTDEPETDRAPGRIDAADDLPLARAAKHDPLAFGRLYDRYLPAIYAYAFRRLRTREEAEDATALIFAKALAGIEGFREDAPSFRAWLFGIAHNAVVDTLRTRPPETVLPVEADAELADTRPGPEELTVRRDDLARLNRLLAQLPPEQARLVELRLAGLTDREIAHALGRSHGAIRVAQFRALRRLRALAQEEEQPR